MQESHVDVSLEFLPESHLAQASFHELEISQERLSKEDRVRVSEYQRKDFIQDWTLRQRDHINKIGNLVITKLKKPRSFCVKLRHGWLPLLVKSNYRGTNQIPQLVFTLLLCLNEDDVARVWDCEAVLRCYWAKEILGQNITEIIMLRDQIVQVVPGVVHGILRSLKVVGLPEVAANLSPVLPTSRSVDYLLSEHSHHQVITNKDVCNLVPWHMVRVARSFEHLTDEIASCGSRCHLNNHGVV